MPTLSLPDGPSIHYLNRNNALLIYDEVMRDQVYFRHGICVRDGDCIFDIGANIGLFLLQLNQRLESATVYSFEPIPETFAVLERNARDHNRLRLHLFNCGLAREQGEATFSFFPNSPADSSRCADDSEETRQQQRDVVLNVMGGGSNIRLSWPTRSLLGLTPRWLKRWIAELVRRHYMTPRKVTCPLANLSSIIDERGIGRIDLLKMDIEGGEFDALAGLRAEHWPLIRQIVLEVHGGEPAKRRMAQTLAEHDLNVVIVRDPLRRQNFLFYAHRQA